MKSLPVCAAKNKTLSQNYKSQRCVWWELLLLIDLQWNDSFNDSFSSGIKYVILILIIAVFCLLPSGQPTTAGRLHACCSYLRQPRQTGRRKTLQQWPHRQGQQYINKQKNRRRPARGTTQDGAEIPLMYFSIHLIKKQDPTAAGRHLFITLCFFFLAFSLWRPIRENHCLEYQETETVKDITWLFRNQMSMIRLMKSPAVVLAPSCRLKYNGGPAYFIFTALSSLLPLIPDCLTRLVG